MMLNKKLQSVVEKIAKETNSKNKDVVNIAIELLAALYESQKQGNSIVTINSENNIVSKVDLTF